MIQVLVWWLVMQVLGWLAFPTAMRIFRWLPDRGYSFSKTLGLLLVSFVLWFGASTGLLSNDTGGILLSVLILAGLSAWFVLRRKDDVLTGLGTFLREKWRLVVTVEVIFILALLGWAIFRAYVPFKIENTSGEKFMEIAFQNAILRSGHFPPLDPWLSGFGISYYYFGYVMMAMLTRLTGAVSGVAFDLYDSLLFALTLLGSFGIVYNLVAASRRKHLEQAGVVPREGPALASGVLGAVLVTIMSNLEGVLESLHASGMVSARFWNWIDIPSLSNAEVNGSWYPGNLFWWWWRASRVLADKNLLGQDITVQPINEFPFFSFLLGDNHPHVLALPFVLLAIGLAFNLLLRQVNRESTPLIAPQASATRAQWWNPPAFTMDNDWFLFVFCALILGALGFLNTWDLPIYLGLVMLAYGLGSVLVKGILDREIVTRCLSLGLGTGILSGLLYIFFYLSFSSQASGILPYIFPPTRLPQYLVMFGTFIFLVGCFMLVYLVKQRKAGLFKSALNWWWRILLICISLYLLILLLVAGVIFLQRLVPGSTLVLTIQSSLGGMGIGQAFAASASARLRDPWLMLLVSALLAFVIANISSLVKEKPVTGEDDSVTRPPAAELSSDSFVFLLVFTGLALSFIVEFVYLRDSFGVRMNTVFKFYYQAWVMLGCASAYAVWWVLDHLERAASRALFSLGVVLMVSLGLVYTVMALPSRAADFKGPANLDGSSSVAQANPDDWAAIQWLDANAQEGMPPESVPVILEAPGDSYHYEGRISAFTGFPTVLGWLGHEGQWRGNYDEQGRREPDIATIYTTSDGQTALDLLDKWDVSFVILGSPEVSYIRRLCTQPERGCNLGTALHKFDQVLQPVFNQGNVTIYKVP